MVSQEIIFNFFNSKISFTANRRCPPSKLYWTKEENIELTGPYDPHFYENSTLEECKTMCLLSSDIFCRSIEFNEKDKTCIISDEDSYNRRYNITKSASADNIYMELTCMDGNKKQPLARICS